MRRCTAAISMTLYVAPTSAHTSRRKPLNTSTRCAEDIHTTQCDWVCGCMVVVGIYDVLLCFHLPQLISDALHNKIVKGQDFISMDGHINLTSRIAAVHIVYRAVCECVHWFGQLTLHNPGILAGLVAQQIVPEDDECMVRLHYCTVLKLSLSPRVGDYHIIFGLTHTLRASAVSKIRKVPERGRAWEQH